MAQDIRKMIRDEKPESQKLSEGHEAVFAKRLEEEFASNVGAKTNVNKDPYMWRKIAAMIVVAVGIGYLGYYSLSEKVIEPIADTTIQATEQSTQIRLGDISPALKKVENFYQTGINVQLASLQTDTDNRDLIDGYMQRLSELDKEYARLSIELNEVGPSEATITALVDNLKLRLELLFKLKNKLKELKNQENEQFESIET
jgi:hypothetical protein